MHYHHIGIPTEERKGEETYLDQLKIHVTDHKSNPYGVQWMRFDSDCPLPDLVKKVPHVAFQVANLKEAILGKDVIIKPNSPSPGVMVAFIVEDGAPIEFLQLGDLE